MKCSHCKEEIGEISFCFGSNAPYHYLVLNEEERQSRCEITSDLCVIDQEKFFIRGHLEIPIIGTNDFFIWSVWSSISDDNFYRTNEVWNSETRMNEPAYFGWISTELPLYPSTLSLKCEVQTREIGSCPVINLELTDHILALEQRNGISIDRIHEINHLLLHKTD